MKHLKYCFLTTLLIAINISCNAEVTVSVTPVPSYTPQVYYYVTGTLTNAKSQIPTGEAGEGYFYGKVKIDGPSTYELTSSDCECTETQKEGKKYKIISFNFHIHSILHIIYEPKWINRVTCEQADNEWKRYSNDIFNHEYRHYTDYKSYVDDVDNYKNVVTVVNLEIECSEQTEEEAEAFLLQKIADTGNHLEQKIISGITQLKNNFHGETGRPNKFPEIDLSKECH